MKKIVQSLKRDMLALIKKHQDLIALLEPKAKDPDEPLTPAQRGEVLRQVKHARDEIERLTQELARL